MSGRKNRLEDLSTEELIEEYKALYDAVFNVGCYSISDYLRLCAIEAELLRRGCRICQSVEVIPPDENGGE